MPKENLQESWRGAFTRAWSDRTGGNGFKLKKSGFRKKFFTVRVVSPWPREAVGASSLEMFKARLDRALSNLGWWKASLLMAVVWNWMVSNVPSNPKHPVVL